MQTNRSWLTPLIGVLFIVVVIVGFAVAGEPPDTGEESAQEIVDFFVDNEGQQLVGVVLEGIAAILLVFWGGYLRRVLRDAEGPQGMLSAVVFAGVIILATGLAVDATIIVALVDSAEDVDPVAAQTLLALYENDFVPLALGVEIFLLGTGLSLIRYGALPAWLGWIAVVLAVLGVTPIGWVAAIGAALLLLVMSVLLALRARAAPAGANA